MFFYRKRAALALAILALGAGLAGCGSSDNGVASKSAAEILAAATAAAQHASSVHVVSGASVRRTKFTLDAIMASGQGQARASLLGTAFEAIRTANTLYLKGNATLSARLGATLGVKIPPNTWLKGPANGTLKQLGLFTSTNSEIPWILGKRGTLTKGAIVKINGQPAIELKQVTKLYTGVLYIATTGEPYPIKLLKHGRETGQTTFTAWNDPVSVSAPENAVELSQLQHKGS